MRVRRLWLWLGVLTASVGMAIGWSVTALAAPPFPIFNRAEFHGYFTDIQDCRGHDVWAGGIPGNLTNSGQFINFVLTKLGSGSAQDRVGAAFIIQTMRGGVSRANPPTGAEINDWVQRVQYAESQGWIQLNGAGQWNWPFTRNVNSMYQGPPNNGSGSCPSRDPIDDAYYPNSGTDAAIVFRNPSTGEFYYALRIVCANPVGVLPGIPGLPEPNFSLTASLAPGAGTPGSMGIVQPGVTYYLSPSVANSGPAASSFPTYVHVNNLNPANVSNAGVSSSDPGRIFGSGYSAAPCLTGPQCWYWWYNSIPPGVVSTQVNGAAFRVNPGTPEGTIVCFNVVVFPSDRAGNIFTAPNLCFRVFTPHYPGIIGNSGDVHAGGNLCGQAAGGSGSVATSALNNSLTEYVLSASGSVSNFGSDNAAGGATATLGRTGSYYSICRPDLVKTARDYFLAGGAYTPLGAGSWDLSSLPASANGIYIHNGGGNINLRGTFNRKITIVSFTGTVTINGSIILNAPNLPGSQAPSLGIISAGDVFINGVATRVDAYVFSDGTINTCTEGNTPACLNTVVDPAGRRVGLLVNGFLMGRGISFRRLGLQTTTATATIGEEVTLTGQLYLNPPKFFDNVADVNLLQGQGERPPLN